MKKGTYHIIYSWVLLLCFVTGQYMVYAHQHNIIKKAHAHAYQSNENNSSQQTVKEKCAICDSMHHNNMELNSSSSYHSATVTAYAFVTFEYDFKSISLILSPGRAPPVVS